MSEECKSKPGLRRAYGKHLKGFFLIQLNLIESVESVYQLSTNLEKIKCSKMQGNVCFTLH